MNDMEHPRMASVIRAIVLYFILPGFILIFTAFMLYAFFTSRDGKIALGFVLVGLSWLWKPLLILVAIWLVARSVQNIIEERERIAQERHKQILEALHQIRDKLWVHTTDNKTVSDVIAESGARSKERMADWNAREEERMARFKEELERINKGQS